MQVGYFGDGIGCLPVAYPEKNQKRHCSHCSGHGHPGQDPGATSRSCDLFLYALAKFNIRREIPAGAAQGALQPSRIRNLRGTPRALGQMFPYRRRCFERKLPIQIGVKHFGS
jgi:hypothetical protein